MGEFLKSLPYKKLFLPLVSLFIVLLINLIIEPRFFDTFIEKGVLQGDFIEMINTSSELVLIVIGMTLIIIITGGVDISVGAVMAITSSVCCLMLSGGKVSVDELSMNIVLAMFVAIIIAAICGGFNGFLIGKIGIKPMMATLILYMVGRSVAQIITSGQIIYIKNDSYKVLGGYIGKFPVATPIVITIIILIITWAILRFTSIGKSISKGELKTVKAKIVICIVGSAFAGIAGLISSSRIYSADFNNIGLNTEWDAIMALVIGGNLLSGAKCSIVGSIIGAYTVQAFSTMLYAVSIPQEQVLAYKAIVVIGLLIIQSPIFNRFIVNIKENKSTITEGEK